MPMSLMVLDDDGMPVARSKQVEGKAQPDEEETCDNCGEAGHGIKSCPLLHRAPDEAEEMCDNCGEAGHGIESCPMLGGADGLGRPAAEADNGEEAAKRPEGFSRKAPPGAPNEQGSKLLVALELMERRADGNEHEVAEACFVIDSEPSLSASVPAASMQAQELGYGNVRMQWYAGKVLRAVDNG